MCARAPNLWMTAGKRPAGCGHRRARALPARQLRLWRTVSPMWTTGREITCGSLGPRPGADDGSCCRNVVGSRPAAVRPGDPAVPGRPPAVAVFPLGHADLPGRAGLVHRGADRRGGSGRRRAPRPPRRLRRAGGHRQPGRLVRGGSGGLRPRRLAVHGVVRGTPGGRVAPSIRRAPPAAQVAGERGHRWGGMPAYRAAGAERRLAGGACGGQRCRVRHCRAAGTARRADPSRVDGVADVDDPSGARACTPRSR
jgi:hypothetical protein